MTNSKLLCYVRSLCLCLALLPLISFGAVQGQANSQYFPETGKTVSGKFLDYWNTHGSLAQQGYPVSDEFSERSDTNGKTYTVQYFERAVFEYHAENVTPNDILLSLLGVFIYKQKYPGGAPGQKANTEPGSILFSQTGKHVGGLFLDYWQNHGGLQQQGYPLSEEFQEKSPLDGKTYLVQYFERAVFEYHPENQSPYGVLLSQLGKFRFDALYGGPDVQIVSNLSAGESLQQLSDKVRSLGTPFSLRVQVSGKDAPSITQIEWDLGGSKQTRAPGEEIKFSPDKPGRYKVTITAKTANGKSRTVVGPTLSTYAPQSAYPLSRLGVAYDFGWAPEADYPKLISFIKAGCFPSVRMDFRQIAVASDGRYDRYDRPVNALRSADISVQGILDDFGNTGGRNIIPTPEQFAEYAYATAFHYGDKVGVWEIWNEPNLDRYWPNSNAGAYVAVLKQGYLAVKYANPNAFVLLGGLGSNGDDDKSRIADFLSGVYSQGGRGYFDGVPIHPYIDWSGDRPVAIYTKMIQDTRNAMASAGDGNKPLIINEVGWEFGREQSKSQVDAIRQMVSVAFNNGISAFYYYNLRDGLPDGSDFGLLDANSQPRPSYYAYKQLAGCP